MSLHLLSSGPEVARLILTLRPYRERLANAYREYRRLGFVPPRAVQAAREVAAPSPPPAPLLRVISTESGEFCSCCGSTMMRRRFIAFGPRRGCIQPECAEYGGC